MFRRVRIAKLPPRPLSLANSATVVPDHIGVFVNYLRRHSYPFDAPKKRSQPWNEKVMKSSHVPM